MHSTHVLGSGILRDTLTLKQQELVKELRNATAGKKLLKWLFEQFNFYFLLQWYIINKILLEQFHYTQGWRFEETNSVILLNIFFYFDFFKGHSIATRAKHEATGKMFVHYNDKSGPSGTCFSLVQLHILNMFPRDWNNELGFQWWKPWSKTLSSRSLWVRGKRLESQNRYHSKSRCCCCAIRSLCERNVRKIRSPGMYLILFQLPSNLSIFRPRILVTGTSIFLKRSISKTLTKKYYES